MKKWNESSPDESLCDKPVALSWRSARTAQIHSAAVGNTESMIYSDSRHTLRTGSATGGRIAGLFTGVKRVEDGVQEVRQRAALARSDSARIGYIGWAGHGNLGDDAMLSAIGSLLPDTDLISYAYPRKERRLARLGLSGPRFFQSILLGGGTLISDGFAEIPRLAIEQDVPLWSFGTGVGSCGFGMPPQVSLARWLEILPRFRAISVRGPLSQLRLRELGADHVEIIGDPALSLAVAEARACADPPRFALNIALPGTGRLRRDDHPFLCELEILTRRLVRHGWTPVPVAMSDDDAPALADLLARVYGDDVRVPTLRSAEDFIAAVAPCAFTVAVRLHAAVLSCCAGVPPLMLGYRDKCLDFMASMELTDYHVALDDMADGELLFRAERLVEAAESLRAIVLARARAWKQIQAAYLQRTLATT